MKQSISIASSAPATIYIIHDGTAHEYSFHYIVIIITNFFHFLNGFRRPNKPAIADKRFHYTLFSEI